MHAVDGARCRTARLTTRGAEFNLLIFRELGRDDLADEILRRIAELTGITPTAAQ